MSALDSPSIQKRGEALEVDSQAPKYGFAGNRCFTPEARFTGVMDFLTQVTSFFVVPVSRKSSVVCSDECNYLVSQSPAEMHSSYTKTKLGSFYQNDMAINRNHYTDPLDNNQIPPHQSLLPQVCHLI